MLAKTCRALGMLIAVLGCLPLHAQQAAKVYVGGGDEHRGAFDGYLNDPEGWAWVRQNADGYYLNTFPLKSKGNGPPPDGRLSAMAGLFTHKSIFYETEAESYAHRVTDADDQARIALLQKSGFTVDYIACNGAFTDERAALLKTWRGTRPPHRLSLSTASINRRSFSSRSGSTGRKRDKLFGTNLIPLPASSLSPSADASPMFDALLHREVCHLRVAREESCRRPGSRWRLRLWTASIHQTHALLFHAWQRPATELGESAASSASQTRR